MKNTLKSISYIVALLVAVPLQAAAASPFEAIAKAQGRQAVAAARELVRAELGASMGHLSAAEAGTGSEIAAVLNTALSGPVELAELPCESSAPAE